MIALLCFESGRFSLKEKAQMFTIMADIAPAESEELLRPSQDLRLLNADEIDLVAGGRRASAVAYATATATGTSTYTDTNTYAFAQSGLASVAIAVASATAIGFGPGSSASGSTGAWVTV